MLHAVNNHSALNNNVVANLCIYTMYSCMLSSYPHLLTDNAYSY